MVSIPLPYYYTFSILAAQTSFNCVPVPWGQDLRVIRTTLDASQDILRNWSRCTHVLRKSLFIDQLKLDKMCPFSYKLQVLASFSFFSLPQAECWLGRLELAMRSTVRQEISEAVAAYEDKPRDQWLLDYPAQVCASVEATQEVWNI